MGACLFKPQTFKVSWLCNSKCIPVHIFMRETRALSFFLSLDSCTLVALVNLSMSILRDKNSPHGCPHTGGGHCAGTLITRQALSVGACIHINTAIVFPCGGRRMHLLFYSPQMCWDRVAFMILIGGSNGVLKSLVSSSFFFHNSTIFSQRVLSKRWKEGRWGLHMFWGPCMGISMCM